MAPPEPVRGAGITADTACFHCGEACDRTSFTKEDKAFCCQGCLMVHDLLTESGLGHFYDLNQHPGVRIRPATPGKRWAYLDEPELQRRVLDFTDGKVSRVTFQIPAIHCVACVWLLENLFQLHPGIGRSQVNFPKREVAITFATAKISLSEVVALLASIGYEPALTLGELEKAKPSVLPRQQALQLGIAGFAFGNIMLFSLPTYLGFDSFSGPAFKLLFGWLSLALAVPVLAFSAGDYWKSAAVSLRRRVLTLDVPIALGLAALSAQSAFEIISHRGDGYLDSMSGLVFFLLCGRVFQQKTHERMAFDRDYKCFFPLSAMRQTANGEQSVAISNLRVGDRLVVRHGELIPADARLVSGAALIDYSFVTGESEPAVKNEGDYLYAGGRQVGGVVEAEIVKPVSQSYLTSLWNHEAFRKEKDHNLNTLTNRYSRRFTRIVIGVAAAAAVFWLASGDEARAVKALASVLIVACPCALALAAPFALGTAQRLLARSRVFLKNPLVLERMAAVSAIVFDKTGTLTAAQGNAVSFLRAEVDGQSRRDEACQSGLELSSAERRWVCALSRHSTHPLAVRIGEWLKAVVPPGQASDKFMLQLLHESVPSIQATCPGLIEAFLETPGCGLRGNVEGHEVQLGARTWLESGGVAVPDFALPGGSVVHLAIDGKCRGFFALANALRDETETLLPKLASRYEIALLSGDNEKERERFQGLFGEKARLHFNQSPLEKLSFIRKLQSSGRTVMMVGDGLNDAGALKQSDVGVAVVDKVGAFSPASDVILEAGQISRLSEILALARCSVRIVRVSFAISALYNALGIGIAAAGLLSPLVCAVLMPLSSVSVVLFACGATNWAARRMRLTR